VAFGLRKQGAHPLKRRRRAASVLGLAGSAAALPQLPSPHLVLESTTHRSC
jgi:hypothetical protein